MSVGVRGVLFHGRVQGVGFRWTTQRVAERFQVCGWVRNEPDGSVRCEVAGASSEIEAFLDAIEEAMPGHVHHRIDVAADSALIPQSGFEIRR